MHRAVLFAVALAAVQCEYKYETKWFKVPLDHFSYQRNETFPMKYLVNDEHWKKDGGPIFFYTGNEGQIEVFAKNTGFMWEIAEEFQAKLVFAEHRYYGDTMPFGNKSMDNDHIGYLSSSQALADYANLIEFLTKDNPAPVIAFGGSYGGMLSAYIRMKYPHLVTGSIAASAPIHMFPGMAPCETFNAIVTSSFAIANGNCPINIKKSWSVIRNYTSTPKGAELVRNKLNLCKNVTNALETELLFGYLETVYTTLAMVNYPFASEFLIPLPAYPVRVVCQYLDQPLSGDNLLEGLGKMLNVYANYGKKDACVDYINTTYENLDASGWDYQSCTEMVMPICTTGEDDMFEPQPWNYTAYAEGCFNKFRVFPRPNAAQIEYGGNKLGAYSNIVFSNGLMDPWAAGGILSTRKNEHIVAVIIVDAAHHLDLMASNTADPPSVRGAREKHKYYIRKWINQFNDNNS